MLELHPTVKNLLARERAERLRAATHHRPRPEDDDHGRRYRRPWVL